MQVIVILGDATSPHIQRWTSYLLNRKYEVHLISFQPAKLNGIHLHYVKPPNFLIISPITSLWRKFGYIFCLLKVRRLINSLKPDILHAHWATSYGLAGSLSGYHPYIISAWGRDVMTSPRRSWLMKKILQYNLSKADGITATSQMLANETSKYVYTGKVVHHIPFGIDVDLFTPPSFKHSRGSICIGTVKALEEKYGIEFLIRAYAKVVQYEPKSKLLIVGDGSLRNHLLELVEQLRINDNVQFTGRIPNNEIIQYLHKIDIFVVPSISESETFGVSAIEASACSIPVIASNIGGLPEVVVDGVTGLLCPPRNVDALVDKILLLIREKQLRRKLGMNGRIAIESKYTLERSGEMIEKVYNKIVNASN